MARSPEKDCPKRILDAAEAAFADSGYSGASMRNIVRAAQVNPAMVYYYFGSKRGLMEAVLKRRFGPLRQEHLDILRRFQDEAKGRALPVEKILEAMLLPVLKMLAAPAARRHAVTRLMGRIVIEPDEETQQILYGQRAEVRAAFLKAFRASVPDQGLDVLQWRMEFIWGALSFILCNPRKIQLETGGACDPFDADKVLSEMIDFVAAGFHTKGCSKSRNLVRANHSRHTL